MLRTGPVAPSPPAWRSDRVVDLASVNAPATLAQQKDRDVYYAIALTLCVFSGSMDNPELDDCFQQSPTEVNAVSDNRQVCEATSLELAGKVFQYVNKMGLILDARCVGLRDV